MKRPWLDFLRIGLSHLGRLEWDVGNMEEDGEEEFI
jgi:hypothetical protein